jgi:hypothetical protein
VLAAPAVRTARPRPLARKVLETLPALEREAEGLEAVAERLGSLAERLASVADGLAGDAHDAAGLLGELAELRREAEAAQAAAAALAERLDEARATLAQLDEVGVADAAADDRALEELEARAAATFDLLDATLGLIDATADEAAEMRERAGFDAD